MKNNRGQYGQLDIIGLSRWLNRDGGKLEKKHVAEHGRRHVGKKWKIEILILSNWPTTITTCCPVLLADICGSCLLQLSIMRLSHCLSLSLTSKSINYPKFLISSLMFNNFHYAPIKSYIFKKKKMTVVNITITSKVFINIAHAK